MKLFKLVLVVVVVCMVESVFSCLEDSDCKSCILQKCVYYEIKSGSKCLIQNAVAEKIVLKVTKLSNCKYVKGNNFVKPDKNIGMFTLSTSTIPPTTQITIKRVGSTSVLEHVRSKDERITTTTEPVTHMPTQPTLNTGFTMQKSPSNATYVLEHVRSEDERITTTTEPVTHMPTQPSLNTGFTMQKSPSNATYVLEHVPSDKDTRMTTMGSLKGKRGFKPDINITTTEPVTHMLYPEQTGLSTTQSPLAAFFVDKLDYTTQMPLQMSSEETSSVINSSSPAVIDDMTVHNGIDLNSNDSQEKSMQKMRRHLLRQMCRENLQMDEMKRASRDRPVLSKAIIRKRVRKCVHLLMATD